MESMPFGIDSDNDLVGKIRAIAHARTPDMDFGNVDKGEAEDVFFTILLTSLYEDFNSSQPYSMSDYILDKMPDNMRRWYTIKYLGGFDECPCCGGWNFEKLEDGRYYCSECKENF